MIKIKRFGSVTLKTTICPVCKIEAFLRDGVMLCCGKLYEPTGNIVHRLESTCDSRKQPKVNKKDITIKQNYKCFYCDNPLIGMVWYKRKIRRIQAHLDHFQPYSLLESNNQENFVVSCSICNLIKSSKVFDSYEEAREFILNKRARLNIEY